MSDAMARRIRQWRSAWVGLACAIAIHVTDEALTGFLGVYNRTVGRVRTRFPWLPLPTFTFTVWLTGLTVGVLLLLGLTPLISRGGRSVRIASLVLGVLMAGNAVAHVGASLYWGRFAPGVFSAPLLLIAACALLVTAWRARPVESK